jgi:hypothetical protein
VDEADNQSILVVFYCESELYNYFSGNFVSNDYMGLAIAAINLVTVVVLSIFIYYFESSQEAYITEYKESTMEMSDFTICLEDLPPDYHYGGKEN